ncbi:MAG TPA: cytidine deaminase [Desulfitobacteriaceae bacterium]|nr:cytidine deaminase [Desulfitobacteriaceae bacterium]
MILIGGVDISRVNDKQIRQELISQARQAADQAYVPYSHYPVGAAVCFSSGKIYSGCNVENASYGLTICAERNAIFQAAAQGERCLVSMAIFIPQEDFPAPCGACRQVMREFARNCSVILVNGQGATKVTDLAHLLPDSFGPEHLP